MHLAIVSGIASGDTPDSYWPIGWVICKERSQYRDNLMILLDVA